MPLTPDHKGAKPNAGDGTSDKVGKAVRTIKAPPSIDVTSAQNMKSQQKLPNVDRGRNPANPHNFVVRAKTVNFQPTWKHGRVQYENYEGDEEDLLVAERVRRREEDKNRLLEWRTKRRALIEEKGLQSDDDRGDSDQVLKDVTTGRFLSDDGQSCLRCSRKGLNCTLNFFGSEFDELCSACRRSKCEFCIRMLPVYRQVEFYGPPWKNPNWITGRPGQLTREEIEDEVSAHFHGEQKYVAGDGRFEYKGVTDLWPMPVFNGSDIPIDERPEGWSPKPNMAWQDYLPIEQNSSLRQQPAPAYQLQSEEAFEEQYSYTEPLLPEARPSSPSISEEDTCSTGTNSTDTSVEHASIDLFRISRKYTPRASNLADELANAEADAFEDTY
ncbi:hypothetical protein F5Y15DRAFT_398955 [Xylariaceae sp. FL0016]|nr:hypothetical protein F5Y15DRAFT_398955 [Xylariaceae sp. FL0016]